MWMHKLKQQPDSSDIIFGIQAVALESRAEAAENERDDALQRARVFTPRPAPNFEQAHPQLNTEAASLLTEVMDLYRCCGLIVTHVSIPITSPLTCSAHPPQVKCLLLPC